MRSLDGVSTDLDGGNLVAPRIVVTIFREPQLGGFPAIGEMQDLGTLADALRHADLADGRTFDYAGTGDPCR